MKKYILTLLALAMMAGAAAQEPRRGGFMNALKRGVESTTGLDVSQEALFVYPPAGEWKCTLISCVGYRGTGAVELKITASKIMGNRRVATTMLISQARVTGSMEDLPLARRSASPLYDFEIRRPVEITFQSIGSVPDAAVTLDVKFYVGYDSPGTSFELRSVPIQWIE